jgi:uncharacterized protein YqhQ
MFYLQNFAPLSATVSIFARLIHAEGDAVEKDHSHRETLKPAEKHKQYSFQLSVAFTVVIYYRKGTLQRTFTIIIPKLLQATLARVVNYNEAKFYSIGTKLQS